MGSLYLVQVSAPAGSPWNVTTINYTLIYAALSLSLNLAITLAVVARLLLYRHRIVRALGRGFGTQYTSVVAMLVESAALYAVFSLLFLIPFGLQNQLANIMLQALGEIQVCELLKSVFLSYTDELTLPARFCAPYYIPCCTRKSLVGGHHISIKEPRY